MKRLFIVRHAKSDWDNPTLDDFDRPLNKRGERNAPFMGKVLAEKGIKPDAIISSPANRALRTAELIAKEVGYEKNITPNQYIYEAYVTALQEIVEYLYDTHETVLLVGHNPGVSALAYMLCGMTEQMPTCAIVEIEFDCDSWMNASKENSKLISYDYPKNYDESL